MARFKILLFLLVVGLASASVAAAWWYYTREIGHTDAVTKEIKVIQKNKSVLPDAGLAKFEKAVGILLINATPDTNPHLLRDNTFINNQHDVQRSSTARAA